MMPLIRGYALSNDATVQGSIGIDAAGVAWLPRAKSTTSGATRDRYALSKDATVPGNTKSVAIGIDAASVASLPRAKSTTSGATGERATMASAASRKPKTTCQLPRRMVQQRRLVLQLPRRAIEHRRQHQQHLKKTMFAVIASTVGVNLSTHKTHET